MCLNVGAILFLLSVSVSIIKATPFDPYPSYSTSSYSDSIVIHITHFEKNTFLKFCLQLTWAYLRILHVVLQLIVCS